MFAIRCHRYLIITLRTLQLTLMTPEPLHPRRKRYGVRVIARVVNYWGWSAQGVSWKLGNVTSRVQETGTAVWPMR